MSVRTDGNCINLKGVFERVFFSEYCSPFPGQMESSAVSAAEVHEVFGGPWGTWGLWLCLRCRAWAGCFDYSQADLSLWGLTLSIALSVLT